MCGIVGIWNFKEKIDVEEFLMLRDLLSHRGPDGAGIYVNGSEDIALGHRRLSLIDLSSTGTQPMYNEDKTIWLTANGEIYNYKELRKELLSYGHVFSSTSDSEILIHGYEEWGREVLKKLKGMFAFCIYDQKKKLFFLARDRFGIKPCYYYHKNNVFLFASELKSIVSYHGFTKNVDFASVSNYLTYRYVPSPKTIWENTYKLPPAHYLTINEYQNIEITEYWKLESGNHHYNEKYLVENTDEILIHSIQEHLESDVSIGSFLSGGYDSSALVYYMSRLQYPTKTFSIGFKDWEQSEDQFAEIVSSKFKTEHTSEILDGSSLDIIDRLVTYYDEPLADISIVPTYFVSHLASGKVKAVLSGEGSDEIFAGYTWHRRPDSKASITERLFHARNKYTFSVQNYAIAMAMGLYDKQNLTNILVSDFQKSIPEDPFWFYGQHFKPELGNVKSFQYLDIKTFMGEIVLTKMDRASMANSLEVRVPFLDHELFEFVFSLPEQDYVKKNIQKFLLFENIKNSLPKEILHRKKQGFVGPDSYYMNMEWYKQNLKDGRLITEGVINKVALDDLINNQDHWRLWKLLILEKWYNRWM
jgi:asparagine synthase (glutamine-hydrolysing)